MIDPLYLITAVVISGLITLALRALPFAILKPLRKSRFVKALGRWMPAGILLILAVVVLRGEILSRPGDLWAIAAATAVTVLVHLLAKRRALLSIAAGTACYVLLLNMF
ncbi:branched-chain amino acid transporter AzlD [Leucobacter viscericola]|uniref:Branched-chain amino acid transporter AzlD n=1 Tax=Leucobacter viscericola TaxID=2714935 RepID=A0A6G7XCS5_9MICO|nr:AzlD domain-containing protein [Leucobacter viscericola]QIK62410.1 branched-chain amino acid transporter AzlD [Leucobacter viscericola]